MVYLHLATKTAVGAMLSDVTADLLLPLKDYQFWSRQCVAAMTVVRLVCSNPKLIETLVQAGIAHKTEGKARLRRMKHVEQHLPELSARAWTTVIMQVCHAE